MKYDDFVKEVQTRARLNTLGEAVEATRATLEALGKCISQEEANHLMSELPKEIGVYLEDIGEPERFSLDDFFKYINQNERKSVGLAESVHHARSVISVLQDAVSKGEMNDIKSMLSEEFEPLFRAGSEDYMSMKDYKTKHR
ncbi:DUF2267 domain-containing protein [Candidatus Poribacteria bacterium]|nr:DUF2267 domain-containing protein [Candidatus Poribacteria bacterium]